METLSKRQTGRKLHTQERIRNQRKDNRGTWQKIRELFGNEDKRREAVVRENDRNFEEQDLWQRIAQKEEMLERHQRQLESLVREAGVMGIPHMIRQGELDMIFITDEPFNLSEDFVAERIYRDERVEKFFVKVDRASGLPPHNLAQNLTIKVINGIFTIDLFKTVDNKLNSEVIRQKIEILYPGDEIEIEPYMFHEIVGRGEYISIVKPPLSLQE